MVVPHSGQPTETFIRRYCEQLAPGNTVLVHFYHGSDAWIPDCPTFFLQDAFFGSAKLARVYRAMQKALGIGSLFGDPYTAGCLLRFFQRENVSVVFSQYLVTGWNIHHVVRRAGLRHVVRGLGFDTSGCLDNPLWKKRYLELKDATAMVVTSPFQVSRLREIGLDNKNLVPLCCGVDLPDIQNQNDTLRLDQEVRVVAAGRMIPKKAPLKLLEAFFLAAAEVPGLKLTYIGDGPLFGAAVKFSLNLDSREQVEFCGRLRHHEMLEKVAEADVFMQHSVTDSKTGDQEGVPVAILEAMAHGLPVVSTIHSGIPFVVEADVSGFLTPEGDVPAMAQSLIRLARDAQMRRSMGKAGRERVRQFSWEKEKGRLCEILFGNNNPQFEI